MSAANFFSRRFHFGMAVVAMLGAVSGSALAADVKAGAAIYQRHCEGCHGASGRGDFPGMPDFSRGEGLFKSNVALTETIKSGKVAMPAFDGLLTDNEILDVIAYLRTLR